MKDKVIETAGKTWRFLGQNGETNVGELSRLMKEKEPVVLQALGWLAREDKIHYALRNRKTFVSLVEQEMRAFNAIVYKITNEVTSQPQPLTRARTKKNKI